jgi:hypothetical protein
MKIILTRTQKIIAIFTMALILLCEITVLGINYYYRNDIVASKNINLMQKILNSRGKAGLIEYLNKVEANLPFMGIVVKDVESKNLDELRASYGKLSYDIDKDIKSKDDKNIIMHLIALSFLVLGSAVFFIAKTIK